MKVQTDKLPVTATSERRSIWATVLGFLVLDIDLGWSSTAVGKLYGRLKLPSFVPGFIYLDIDIFGKNVINGCWQLA